MCESLLCVEPRAWVNRIRGDLSLPLRPSAYGAGLERAKLSREGREKGATGWEVTTSHRGSGGGGIFRCASKMGRIWARDRTKDESKV